MGGLGGRLGGLMGAMPGMMGLAGGRHRMGKMAGGGALIGGAAMLANRHRQRGRSSGTNGLRGRSSGGMM